mmetsp:Transcript_6893/g.19326  ORF Transcript_6893/g.19326 Transcript_6893/m.19326 type:complete len:279 (+) Transcript_6893:148-984(+)
MSQATGGGASPGARQRCVRPEATWRRFHPAVVPQVHQRGWRDTLADLQDEHVRQLAHVQVRPFAARRSARLAAAPHGRPQSDHSPGLGANDQRASSGPVLLPRPPAAGAFLGVGLCGVLHLRVPDHRQHGWQAGAAHGHVQPAGDADRPRRRRPERHLHRHEPDRPVPARGRLAAGGAGLARGGAPVLPPHVGGVLHRDPLPADRERPDGRGAHPGRGLSRLRVGGGLHQVLVTSRARRRGGQHHGLRPPLLLALRLREHRRELPHRGALPPRRRPGR